MGARKSGLMLRQNCIKGGWKLKRESLLGSSFVLIAYTVIERIGSIKLASLRLCFAF